MRHIKTLRRLLRQYWQFSLAAFVALVSLGFQLFGPQWVAHWLLAVASLGLTIPLLMDMWQDIRAGSYGIDILAATAIITSVLLHQYWAAIVIVIMLTGGEALEDYAERHAHSELEALLAGAPQQAHILRGRKIVDVSASDVHMGDKIFIKVGEVVPADATIIEGDSEFDESSLTGESLPVDRKVGEQILSGSINQAHAITAKALHSAADSQYQQIIKLVRSGSAHQAPFVRLADRYSIPFTITAYAIAAAAWIVGHHAIRFLEVIVVATPCPLLLAAPIALISGMSRANKYGIIIKSGAALERLAETETFAFDKTGTLTTGKPSVQKIIAYKPYDQDEVLGYAASLEEGSAHVLAKAVVDAAKDKKISYRSAKHISEVHGHGLKATVQGKEILVGQLSMLNQHNVILPPRFNESAGQTVAYVAVDGKLAGTIQFKDEVRPESKQTLALLKKLGIKHTLMVTGDNEKTAQAIAKQLGISQVRAEALPADKLIAIEKITDRPVAFVGDGVNDAPVLTAAEVGIALGARGSTAASESADVVILLDDLKLVARGLAIAQRTFKIARQSILVGILLSIVLMLIFATGHFPPLLGAVLQEVVDVFVIFNALRAHTGKLAS